MHIYIYMFNIDVCIMDFHLNLAGKRGSIL